MGKEINLLRKYPKSKRNLKERENKKKNSDRIIARKFGKEFFDGERKHGYGGFIYNSKFWKPVVLDLKKYWKLNSSSSVLDVGCAKGFFLYDLIKIIPKIKIGGVDISKYAIKNSVPQIRKKLKIANAQKLPYKDNSFDYVISVNTVHNLDLKNCKKAIKEISIISKKNSFITVDAYRNIKEKKRMFAWNLTAKTILSVNEWKKLFKQCGYKGDYFWFTP